MEPTCESIVLKCGVTQHDTCDNQNREEKSANVALTLKAYI